MPERERERENGKGTVSEGVRVDYRIDRTDTVHLPRTDTLTPAARSERMSRIHGKDTRPEMTVRRLVHGLGYRYRLHRGDLPGKPDLVFFRRRKVIFVHGCFWHRHSDPNCKLARLPKSRLDFWRAKLERNRLRDIENHKKLTEDGWQVLILWECELRDVARLAEKIRSFLEDEQSQGH
ncbi:MAG: DNA mismatch endonuclease Vsr [Candidatus Competibacteraceae bacterium]|nr:DNA mismatch endonuclease Vsr [Candidatus Competibacteraceae bacterium]